MGVNPVDPVGRADRTKPAKRANSAIDQAGDSAENPVADRGERRDLGKRGSRVRQAGQDLAALEARGLAALDAFRHGNVDRRTLLRYAATMGLGNLGDGLAGSLLALPLTARAQTSNPPASAQRGNLGSPLHASAPVPNAVVRVGNLTPVGAIDPLTASDPATICLLSQTCEYLLNDDADTHQLVPALALSWRPDATGAVWTFTLRESVRFHDGQVMTAADVAATFNRLTDPASGSAALSIFRGVLSKGGARVIDAHTVAFHLDSPNGNFPYYVSSDNYNACILPASHMAAGAAAFEKSFIGTGPFRLSHYTARLGAAFVRNDNYWGEKALPTRTEFSFYQDQQSQILALQGRDVDVVVNFAVQGGRALLNASRFKVQSVRSSSHRQMHMRCDAGPFADRRVRQALALAIDRQSIVQGIFLNRAQLANDNPFAPIFPSAPRDLPQRHLDIPRAKALLAEAANGKPARIATTLVTEKFMEMPDYAVLVQNAAASIGIDLRLRIESQSAYYGSAVRGQSDWLDSTIGITDYGHRGVPNVFLDAPLSSHGGWNAARFNNPDYDGLLKRFTAALDLPEQRSLASEIGQVLLDETPLVIAYFFDAMIAMRADLQAVRFTAITQLDLSRAWIGSIG